MLDLSRALVFKKFDRSSENWYRWLWEAFFFFYLLSKKSVATLSFELSVCSWTNKLSIFSTRERILYPRVVNMERSCSISNTSSTSLVEGRVGGVLSSSSWSSLFSLFPPSITLAMMSSANDSAHRFGWMTSLFNAIS